MNNWKEIEESFIEIYKNKIRVELVTYPVDGYLGLGTFNGGYLRVVVLHPSADNCEEELIVFYDEYSRTSNPWRHYSEKVEADLNEIIGIKLAEQKEQEELEKLAYEEKIRLKNEKARRILDSY